MQTRGLFLDYKKLILIVAPKRGVVKQHGALQATFKMSFPFIPMSMFLYLISIFFACVCCIVVRLVVEQERVHHNLLKGVEGYDKDSMKHTETQEKVCLPDPEGLHFGH